MLGVGSQNRFWQDSIQWVVEVGVGAQPEGRYPTCSRAVEFHQRWEQGPATLVMLGWKREGHRKFPGVSLGSKLWDSPAEIPVIHLFFQLVWFVPMPMLSAGVVGEGWPRGRCSGVWDWVAEWVLAGQCPVGGGGWGESWSQVSHLPVGCTRWYYCALW